MIVISASDIALMTTAMIVQFKILIFIACLSNVMGASIRDWAKLEAKHPDLQPMNLIHIEYRPVR